MSETKTEIKQALDEDERKRFLENYSAYELIIDMISYVPDKKIQSEFRDIILQFIIDNDIDLKQL